MPSRFTCMFHNGYSCPCSETKGCCFDNIPTLPYKRGNGRGIEIHKGKTCASEVIPGNGVRIAPRSRPFETLSGFWFVHSRQGITEASEKERESLKSRMLDAEHIEIIGPKFDKIIGRVRLRKSGRMSETSLHTLLAPIMQKFQAAGGSKLPIPCGLQQHECSRGSLACRQNKKQTGHTTCSLLQHKHTTMCLEYWAPNDSSVVPIPAADDIFGRMLFDFLVQEKYLVKEYGCNVVCCGCHFLPGDAQVIAETNRLQICYATSPRTVSNMTKEYASLPSAAELISLEKMKVIERDKTMRNVEQELEKERRKRKAQNETYSQHMKKAKRDQAQLEKEISTMQHRVALVEQANWKLMQKLKATEEQLRIEQNNRINADKELVELRSEMLKMNKQVQNDKGKYDKGDRRKKKAAEEPKDQ
eukprot:m.66346 g.66346  ORF g.66346 m.66346 type:complete len:417 (+) comp11799_c0_seq2:95-1345(+)